VLAVWCSVTNSVIFLSKRATTSKVLMCTVCLLVHLVLVIRLLGEVVRSMFAEACTFPVFVTLPAYVVCCRVWFSLGTALLLAVVGQLPWLGFVSCGIGFVSCGGSCIWTMLHLLEPAFRGKIFQITFVLFHWLNIVRVRQISLTRLVRVARFALLFAITLSLTLLVIVLKHSFVASLPCSRGIFIRRGVYLHLMLVHDRVAGVSRVKTLCLRSVNSSAHGSSSLLISWLLHTARTSIVVILLRFPGYFIVVKT